MARRGSVLGVTAVAVLLVFAACSSSDGDGDVAVTPSIVATVPSATDAPTTTSAPTTTAAPTTTIDPADELAAQVEADFREADRLANDALQDPFNPAKEAAALERRIGFARDSLEQTLDDYRQSNRTIRPNLQVSPSIVVEVYASLVLEGADVAELQVCEIDSWILVEVGAGPGGTDAIIDPNVVAYRLTVFMRKVDGVWLLEGGNELARWEGVTQCSSVEP